MQFFTRCVRRSHKVESGRGGKRMMMIVTAVAAAAAAGVDLSCGLGSASGLFSMEVVGGGRVRYF